MSVTWQRAYYRLQFKDRWTVQVSVQISVQIGYVGYAQNDAWRD